MLNNLKPISPSSSNSRFISKPKPLRFSMKSIPKLNRCWQWNNAWATTVAVRTVAPREPTNMASPAACNVFAVPKVVVAPSMRRRFRPCQACITRRSSRRSRRHKCVRRRCAKRLAVVVSLSALRFAGVIGFCRRRRQMTSRRAWSR